MRFVKWHGLGNDYLFTRSATGSLEDAAHLARSLSDRRRGPGADGLVVLGPPSTTEADLKMTIFNADGSDGGVCGNGLRCAAAWTTCEPPEWMSGRDGPQPGVLRIETPAGISTATVEPPSGDTAEDAEVRWMVSVALPPPRFELASVPATPPDRDPGSTIIEEPISELARSADLPEDTRWSLVSTGNPHLIARVEDDATFDAGRMGMVGPTLEHHRWFPERINAHLASVESDRIRIRTWERGSGETTACGTGACAVVASLVRAGRVEADTPHLVSLPGGDLRISWGGGGRDPIHMTGEAVRVCAVEVDDRWIEHDLRGRRPESG